MKRIIILSISFILINIGLLSGCVENKTEIKEKTDEEKIIGMWETSNGGIIYEFYKNSSLYYLKFEKEYFGTWDLVQMKLYQSSNEKTGVYNIWPYGLENQSNNTIEYIYPKFCCINISSGKKYYKYNFESDTKLSFGPEWKWSLNTIYPIESSQVLTLYKKS